MKMPVRFWPWTGLFASVGLLLPLGFCVHWFVFKGTLSSLEFFLWPFSIMFMALDDPKPAATSTVAIVFIVALIENLLLYAFVSASLWIFFWAISRAVSRLRPKPR